MDPLSVLRDFTIRNNLSAITRISDTYHFGNTYSFPAATETAFRSKQGPPYTLETLIFFSLNHTQKHTDYIQSSRLLRIPPVTLPDRKPLLDYLHGLISSSLSIDHIPHYIPPSLPPSLPNTNIEIDIHFLRSRERPLKDRDAILESRNRDFYSVIVASSRREEERQQAEMGQRKDEIVAKTRIAGDEVGEGVPIILVPSAFQTLITIYNVREFFGGRGFRAVGGEGEGRGEARVRKRAEEVGEG